MLRKKNSNSTSKYTVKINNKALIDELNSQTKDAARAIHKHLRRRAL